jgi:hypothetical protein
MPDAFVETTVLTDFLLKKDGSEVRARVAFEKYQTANAPQFAWKEFKRGPLANFVWAHNKLAETGSFIQALSALQRMSRSPRRYLTSTAIQALHTGFAGLFDSATLQSLKGEYGEEKLSLDKLHADLLRLEIKKAIYSSWGRRKLILGAVFQPLKCYPDRELTDSKMRIELDPRDCPKDCDCCLKDEMVRRRKSLELMRNSLRDGGSRNEIARRIRVLRQIEKHPNTRMSAKECRDFGDAYFALFCPDNAVIITTNIRDIEPLATSLGVKVEAP